MKKAKFISARTIGSISMGTTQPSVKQSYSCFPNTTVPKINMEMIRKYNCMGKQSKDAIYQLIDNFTIFYFQYLKSNKNNDAHFWTNNIGSTLHRAWSGIAFERVCLQHINQIKAALGISGVLTNVYSWRTEANENKGIDKTQIDLLIDRNDGVINLCEMKFSAQEYAITADEEIKLRRRRGNFITATQTKKAVHITLVTPYGLKRNAHSAIV